MSRRPRVLHFVEDGDSSRCVPPPSAYRHLHTHLFDPSVVALSAGLVAGVPVRLMTRHYSDYHTRIDKTWHTRLVQRTEAIAR